MAVPWEKVLTNPLGLAGYALFLVFVVVKLLVKQRKPRNNWIVPVGFALAAACVFGGLGLAYLHQSRLTVQPTPSMKIGNVDQKVKNGNAVTGVQGDVTITPDPPPKNSVPK